MYKYYIMLYNVNKHNTALLLDGLHIEVFAIICQCCWSVW